jgi:pimeloyl-ACP methyl ester carboxylesterase
VIPVSFPVAHQNVKGTLFFPEKKTSPAPGVLFVHGWGSSQAHYGRRAAPLVERGCVCLTIDLRGHGDSDGDFTSLARADHLEDVVAAYDFLASQEGVDRERIGVCGTSYGGYLSSILTSRRAVRWLVLRVPALYKNDNFNVPTARLIADDPHVFSQSGIAPQDNFALQALERFTGSALLIESEKDEEIAHATIENYLSVLKNKPSFTYKIIRAADHSLSEERWDQEFIKILADWFAVQISE